MVCVPSIVIQRCLGEHVCSIWGCVRVCEFLQIQNASVCRFKMSPCVPPKRQCLMWHGRLAGTRRRFESALGGLQRAAPHTPTHTQDTKTHSSWPWSWEFWAREDMLGDPNAGELCSIRSYFRGETWRYWRATRSWKSGIGRWHVRRPESWWTLLDKGLFSWRDVAILTCKSFVKVGYRAGACFPQDSWKWTSLSERKSVTTIIWRGPHFSKLISRRNICL